MKEDGEENKFKERNKCSYKEKKVRGGGYRTYIERGFGNVNGSPGILS